MILALCSFYTITKTIIMTPTPDQIDALGAFINNKPGYKGHICRRITRKSS
jgi:hypothetical protein